MKKTEHSVSFSPIPDAEELVRLEALSPGITDRFMMLVETEQEKRWAQKNEMLDLERKSQRDLNMNVRIGQILAFGSVLVITGLCVFFAHSGNVKEAADTAKFVITGLALAFITGKISTRIPASKS